MYIKPNTMILHGSWLSAFCCLVALSACSSGRTVSEFTPEENRQLEMLHGEIKACAYENLPAIDDGVSSANRVAISLSLKCENQYHSAYQYVADTMGLSERKARQFMTDAESTETKLKTYLSFVKRYRRQRGY